MDLMLRRWVIGAGGVALLAAGLFMAATQNRPDPLAFAKPYSKSDVRSYVRVKYASGKPDKFYEERHIALNVPEFENCQSWFFVHGDPTWTKPKEPFPGSLGSTLTANYERVATKEWLSFAVLGPSISYSRMLSKKEISIVRLLHPFKDPFTLIEEEDRGVKVP